jgi:glycine C-acetyltransferase
MLQGKFSYTPPAALSGGLRDYRRVRGADLQARIEGFAKWRSLRQQHGLWPFARTREAPPLPATAAQDGGGERLEGLNFACEDTLNLASHPEVQAAARQAMESFGLHSGGPAAMLGATALSETLERRTADFLDAPAAVLFQSGWAAAFGAVRALARATDHVVMDALAPAGLREGAAAATRNLYLFRHNRVDECRTWLEKIRTADAENSILVAVESLSSSDSAPADVRALQALCHEFDAILMVHTADDLGALGTDGRGVLGEQDMLGEVDVVTGTFARTFAANGGFAACRSAEMAEYLRAFASPVAHSSALSPVQVAAILKAMDIVESAEGETLRDRLAANVAALRKQLEAAGLETMGAPAPAICVKLGADGLGRLVVRQLAQAGVIANLVEFPAAPKDEARLRLQVMAQHSKDDIRSAAAALVSAWQAAREEFEWLNSEREKLRAKA